MFCIRTSENDREMSVVNPAAFPIYLRLYGCEPWIAEDGLMFAEVGEEELKGNSGGAGAYIENGVVTEVSTSVLGPINIEQFARVRELFDGEFEPFGLGEVHKVFGRS